MLPWSAFQQGVFEKDTVVLKFNGLEIEVGGRDLRELWQAVQLQDVRVIRILQEVAQGDCHVQSLQVTESMAVPDP